ncbi:MAG: hypothetical protein ACI9DC_001959 [Gammaproteobacteria bacterium]|jgi:hypothetical protein
MTRASPLTRPFANPLVIDTVRGIAQSSRVHKDCLLYLLGLATVVFIWWPKQSLTEVLQRQNSPDTLLVALLGCGAIVAWFSARAGAEDFALNGQHGLRDWVAGTPLALSKILSGYLYSHLLQCVHLVALTLPIILLTFSVSGGQWPSMAMCLAMAVVQSVFYRLTAAAIYIAIGKHAALTAISVRALVLLTYAITASIVPVASHVVITVNNLDGGSSARGIHATSASVQFLAFYTVASIVVLYVLYRQLSSLRARLVEDDVRQ